jgi:peptide/nickel transport system permease protein
MGILIGGISGLIGGRLDNAIQRLIEVLISIPTLPFWLAMAAMVPIDWSFAANLLYDQPDHLSLLSWMGLARVVRSKFLALRE